MKCSLCGHEFDQDKAEAACKGCPVMKGCRLIRCPNCGLESPPEPKWFKRFREKKQKNVTTQVVRSQNSESRIKYARISH